MEVPRRPLEMRRSSLERYSSRISNFFSKGPWTAFPKINHCTPLELHHNYNLTHRFKFAKTTILDMILKLMKSRSHAMFTLSLLAATAISLPLAATGEVLSLEDTNGSKLTARLVSCDGSNLKVVRVSDKKSFTIPLSRLVQSSKDAVKEWQANGGGLIEDFDISVVTGKTNKTVATDDYDDKRVNLNPTLTITNPDAKTPARKAKATILFLGRPVVDSRAIHVFKKSTFDLPSLPPSGSKEFQVGKISQRYDNRGYAKTGSRYIGYVVLIHDDEGGNIYSSKSIPSALTKDGGLTFLKMETGKDYDKYYKPVILPAYIND